MTAVTLTDFLLTTLDVEAGLALAAHHQVLVVADQAGAEMTAGCGVGRRGEDVLRTGGGAVGGEHLILVQTASALATVEVVRQTALLHREYPSLRITTELTD